MTYLQKQAVLAYARHGQPTPGFVRYRRRRDAIQARASRTAPSADLRQPRSPGAGHPLFLFSCALVAGSSLGAPVAVLLRSPLGVGLAAGVFLLGVLGIVFGGGK